MVEAIKKILITGASGLLGGDLIKVLSNNFEILAITREHAINCSKRNVLEKKIDLSLNTAEKDLIKLNPDIIVHAASLTDVDFCQTHPDEAIRNNVTATEIVASVAKKLNAKLIYLSTDQVFDGDKLTKYSEEDKPRPLNIYGQTKLQAENIIKSNLKQYLILRVSWLFGRRDKGFINFVLKSAKKNKEINIVCDKFSSPTYTCDVGKAIEFLIDNFTFSGEIIHFTNNGQGCSWLEYAKEIIKICGLSDIMIKPITLAALNLPAPRPKSTILDISKFLKLYNQPLLTWQEALNKCLA
jgi:dTDP-4-dehydrorhamnose reductase